MTFPVVWPLLLTEVAGVDDAGLLLSFASPLLFRWFLTSVEPCLW